MSFDQRAGRREFFISEDHLKLLRRFSIEWSARGYLGAPAVNAKRPYGNSDILGDVVEILGWEPDLNEDEEMNPQQEKFALAIHQQMADVLEIVIQTERFAAGRYVQSGWFEPWKPAE